MAGFKKITTGALLALALLGSVFGLVLAAYNYKEYRPDGVHHDELLTALGLIAGGLGMISGLSGLYLLLGTFLKIRGLIILWCLMGLFTISFLSFTTGIWYFKEYLFGYPGVHDLGRVEYIIDSITLVLWILTTMMVVTKGHSEYYRAATI